MKGYWVLWGAISYLMISNFLQGEEEKYLLRYQFQPGMTLKWDVEHRSKIRTSISKTTQDAETQSRSVKVWKVLSVKPDGTAVFEHSVESIDMRQKLSGSAEVRYNSKEGKKPPVGYEDVARTVGKTLMTVTLDNRGKVIKKEKPQGDKGDDANSNTAAITIPLPEDKVAIGQSWSVPCDIDIPLQTGGVKRLKAVQYFTLEEVKTGVATIQMATQILTPVRDPAIESQVVQREGTGSVRFDLEKGCVLSQKLDVDKHVIGFRGDASSLHYVNRFSEELHPQSLRTASRPTTLQ